MGYIDTGVILLYVIGMIYLGYSSGAKVKDADDYAGGTKFGVLSLTGTIMATMVGSGMLIGAVGNAYQYGITDNVFWMYLGFSLGLFFFAIISPKVRETGETTLGGVFETKYNKSTALVATAIIVLYSIAIVAINIAGVRTLIASIVHVIGKDNFPVDLAAVAMTLFAIYYTSSGGMQAIVKMASFQIIIIIVGIIILGPVFGVISVGGLQEVATGMENIGLSLTNPARNGVSDGALGFALAYFLTVPGDPSVPQRALLGENTKTVRQAFINTGVLGLMFGGAMIVMGSATRILHPELPNQELALITLIINHYPVLIKGLTIVGIFGAIISSFDAFLVLASTHMVYDFGPLLGIKEEDRKKYMTITSVVVGVIGIIIAYFISSLFDYLYMVFSIVGSAFVPVLIGALYFEDKVTYKAANASIIVGASVPAVLYLTVGSDVLFGDPVFLGIIASTVTFILVSLFTKKDRKKLTD